MPAIVYDLGAAACSFLWVAIALSLVVVWVAFLRQHAPTHPWRCVCGTRFATRADLEQHEVEHRIAAV